jgi:hypothetical protein
MTENGLRMASEYCGGEATEAEVKKYADAVSRYLEHPERIEALQDSVLKAYLLEIKRRVEKVQSQT